MDEWKEYHPRNESDVGERRVLEDDITVDEDIETIELEEDEMEYEIEYSTPSSGGFNLFNFINAIYYVLFILIFILAEISSELSNSVWIRTYFNFLNFIKGRGAFLIFLGFMNCEIEKNGELVFSIIVWIIAAVNFIVGYKEVN